MGCWPGQQKLTPEHDVEIGYGSSSTPAEGTELLETGAVGDELGDLREVFWHTPEVVEPEKPPLRRS
jgi:hypothetical protein